MAEGRSPALAAGTGWRMTWVPKSHDRWSAYAACRGQPPTSELVRELSDSVSALIHLELRQAELELSRKAREAARGGALLGVPGVLGGVTAGSSASIVR